MAAPQALGFRAPATRIRDQQVDKSRYRRLYAEELISRTTIRSSGTKRSDSLRKADALAASFGSLRASHIIDREPPSRTAPQIEAQLAVRPICGQNIPYGGAHLTG
jgi:hypothetical protein